MPFERRSVSLADIDLDDGAFRITTAEDTEALAASIREEGLLCPPLLIDGERGLRVVSGFRRVAVCRRLNWTTLAAQLPSSPPDRWTCARWAVAANATQRELDPVETGRALRLLLDSRPDDNAFRAAARRFHLPPSPGAAKRFTVLCDLPAAVQSAVARGDLSPGTAGLLKDLSPGEARELADLLTELRLGVNKQREVVESVLEIARRESIPVETLLGTGEIGGLRKAPDLDRGQKGQHLRRHLHHRRFPQLAAAEERFAALREELALPPDIRLDAPPGFEGRHYRFGLAFADPEALSRQLEILGSLLDHPALTRILDRC